MPCIKQGASILVIVELTPDDTQAQLEAEDAEIERLDGMGDLLDDEGFDDFLGSDE